MNSIMFTLGPLEIHWYSFLILMGFVIGYGLTYLELKREKMPISFFSDYFCYLVPIVIIGARAYYVIFEWDYYARNLGEILAVWNGGLAIHGGIIAGLVFTIFYTKKHNVNTLKLFDMLAPVLILGQAIGRWGNFFNSEAYGPVTTLSYLQKLPIPQFVIDGMHIGGVYHQPTFYYESMICLFGFLLIMLVRHYKKVYLGICSGIYFVVYGIARFFIEALRQDSLMLGSLKVAQLVSIVMIFVGIGFFIYAFQRKEYYHVEDLR